MPKDERFYFSHDYNARNDKKISALVREFKSAGYGIYWCMAEMLHEEGGSLEFDELTISAIAKDLNEEIEFVETVIKKCISNFKLFHIDNDNILVANRVNRNLDKRKTISEVRSVAGKNGAIAKQTQAIAKQKEAIAEQNQAKERKEKENKEKEILPIIKNAASAEKNFEVKEILNPESFPNWRQECSSFLKNDGFKKRISKSESVPIGNLEKLMREFVVEQNLKGNFKNEAALISHFVHWYKKYNNNIGYGSSKAFVDVPDDYDYDQMEVW